MGTVCRETIKNYLAIMTVQVLLNARTLCTRCIVGVNDALFAHVSVLLLIAPTLVDNTACINVSIDTLTLCVPCLRDLAKV